MAPQKPSDYLDPSLPNEPLSDPVFLFDLDLLVPEKAAAQDEEHTEETPKTDSSKLFSTYFPLVFTLSGSSAIFEYRDVLCSSSLTSFYSSYSTQPKRFTGEDVEV